MMKRCAPARPCFQEKLMSMQHSAAALALSLLAAAAAASAQAVPSEKKMSLDLANQIASATVAACTSNG